MTGQSCAIAKSRPAFTRNITLSDFTTTNCEAMSVQFWWAGLALYCPYGGTGSAAAMQGPSRDAMRRRSDAALGPICRVRPAGSTPTGSTPAAVPSSRGSFRSRGGYGLLAGVLPSMSRACIRLRGIPERGDGWRSHRCRNRTRAPYVSNLGAPLLLSHHSCALALNDPKWSSHYAADSQAISVAVRRWI